jgi:ElaB protein
MENTATSLEQEIKNYKSKAKELTEKAREKYLENVNDVREMAKLLGGEASVRAKELADHVDEYIEEHPRKAALWGLGIGVGLGLVLGAILRRD